MNERELKAVIDAEIASALGRADGDISKQRALAMDYYLGKPFGNEAEGRSQVVSTDVADTIEWIKPSLLRIFTSTDQAVKFEPQNEEDEDAAEQETDTCNYVFYRENNGFLILYTLFSDALLQKNGFVKVYFDEKEEISKEEYSGLNDEEFQGMLFDEELTPKAHTEYVTSLETEFGPQPVTLHDVVFERKRTEGKIVIENLPPEEVLVSRRANTVLTKKLDFIAHRSRKTVSDLILMGFDSKKVESLPTDEYLDNDQEEIARRSSQDDQFSSSSYSDKSMRNVWLTEAYIRTDYDGDGIAELRQVFMAGGEILSNEEFDGIYISSLTPIIRTHQFFGQSVADLVMDLQLIKSALWRQLLDNLYLSNNGKWGVVKDKVNIDDLLTSRPHGIVRMDEPGMVQRLDNPGLPPEAFSMLEYIDSVRKDRTGVDDNMQGLDPNVLSQANVGAIAQSMEAARQKVELIARIFAETGIKQMFMDIHELLLKHQKKNMIFKLRNKWYSVDPRQWRTRTDMTVSVGLGTGNRDQNLIQLNSILADQKEIAAGGGLDVLVSPKNIYNTLQRKVENAGLKNAGEFFTDPDSVEDEPKQEPPPDPAMEAIKLQQYIEEQRLILDQQKAMSEENRKMMETQSKIASEIAKHLEKMTELELKYATNVPGSAV